MRQGDRARSLFRCSRQFRRPFLVTRKIHPKMPLGAIGKYLMSIGENTAKKILDTASCVPYTLASHEVIVVV